MGKVEGMTIAAMSCILTGTIVQLYKCRQKQGYIKSYGDKYYEYFQLMNRWMIARNEGKKISDYLKKRGIYDIAIYGMGDFANHILEELKDSDIRVKYGIDRDVCCTNSQISNICSAGDILEDVDVVIITPFLSVESIEGCLKQRCPYKLISLEKIIYSL